MNPQQEPQRTCKACNRPLYGRRNKECCNNRCRSKYHNDNNRDPENEQAIIIRTLKANYRILRPLRLPTLNKTLEPLSEGYFTALGYDFSAFTGQCKNPKTGGTIHWVFELGLEQTKDSKGYRLNLRSPSGRPLL